jgi:hypothetical protein
VLPFDTIDKALTSGIIADGSFRVGKSCDGWHRFLKKVATLPMVNEDVTHFASKGDNSHGMVVD